MWTLEFSDFFGAVAAASNRPGDAFLATFQHIAHLLDRAAAGSAQTAPRTARSERNPASRIFPGLGSEQKRQPDSDSKTDQQTQYGVSLRHDIPLSEIALNEVWCRNP